jgi:predicted transcriptional regulator
MDYQEPSNPFVSVHVPIALVALAISMLFFSQIKGVATSTETIKWQSANADKQIAAYKDGKEKLTKAIAERQPLVAQSEELQKSFTEMMKEMNAAAERGNENAKKIINGYGIKVADAPKAPEAKAK